MPDLAYSDLLAGRYLGALARLRAACADRSEDPWTRTLWMWASMSLDPWGDGAWRFAMREALDGLKPAQLRPPAPPLAEAMARYRAVVLMERHPAPETRWAGVGLLPALRAAGATHLAFETFSQGPLDRLQRGGPVLGDSAVYAFDPSRAALLRGALRLGLRLVAFDFPPRGPLRALMRAMRPAVDPATVNYLPRKNS